MVDRAEMLYGSDQRQPAIPAVYVVEPPAAPKATEFDEARSLILAFFRALPEVALTLAAIALILARNAWRWLRSKKSNKTNN